MIPSIQRDTAKIIAFPMRARSGSDRFGAQGSTVTFLPAKRMTYVDYGAWYHDAAVKEERDSNG